VTTVVEANKLPFLPLEVRLMEPSELVMVLANWKAELFDMREKRDEHGRCPHSWGRLRAGDFWRLVNFVLEKITLPSCEVYVGVHRDNTETPMCWAAVRHGELLFTYYRKGLNEDPELRGMLEELFLTVLPVVAIHVRDFNPFRELEYDHASFVGSRPP
jgi:hypothetical protein